MAQNNWVVLFMFLRSALAADNAAQQHSPKEFSKREIIRHKYSHENTEVAGNANQQPPLRWRERVGAGWSNLQLQGRRASEMHGKREEQNVAVSHVAENLGWGDVLQDTGPRIR